MGIAVGWWQFNIYFFLMAVYVDIYLIANNPKEKYGE
jgi:hypothetical protein